MVENRFVMKFFGLLLLIVPFFLFFQNINFNLILPILVFFFLSLITWRIDNFLTLLVWTILGVALFSNSDNSIISTSIFPIVLGAIWLFVIYRYMTWLKHMKVNKTFSLKGREYPISIGFPWLILMIGILNVALAFFTGISNVFFLFVAIFFIGILFFKEHAYLSGSLMIGFSLFVSLSSVLPNLFGIEEIFSSVGELISLMTESATTIETFLGGLIYFLILLTIGILCFKFGGKFIDKLFGFFIILVSLTFFTFIEQYVPFYSLLIPDVGIFETSRHIFLFFVGLIFLLEGTDAGKYDVGDKFGGTFSSIDKDVKRRKEDEREREKILIREQEEEERKIREEERQIQRKKAEEAERFRESLRK